MGCDCLLQLGTGESLCQITDQLAKILLSIMNLWELESSFSRAPIGSNPNINCILTYAEMAKKNVGRNSSLKQLPTPRRSGNFPSIKVPIEAHKRGLNKNRFNLVCRLDLQKITMVEARAQAIALWKPIGGRRLIPVGKGYIAILLDNEEDQNQIWSGGPWGVEFWEVEPLMSLGRSLGTPIQIDHSSSTMDFCYIVKVLVDIDLAAPIPNKIMVEVNDGDFWQRVELGSTPKLCSHCNIIGHSFVECRAIKEQVLRAEEPKEKQKNVDFGSRSSTHQEPEEKNLEEKE
ncbi:hypothetical protein GIB67_004703 [Kingdonia uniflora]|uniref:DUF4283 domain-containing protein n=1 Tax=Kingdonia uniflora TaxID=39325 RepID=A0A7J7P4Z2_9MAGN|nr:hypothetical protein GIB67_004703 [Kingdonia uniflora]